jgi:hypothetical protein
MNVREIEEVIARVVGQTRRELLQRIERLEHVLMEHRLSAVEARAAGGRGPVLDGEVLDLPGDFRLGGGQ